MIAAATAERIAHDAEWRAAKAAFASPLFDALRGDLESLTGFPDTATLNELAARRSPRPINAGGRPLSFVPPRSAMQGRRVADNRYEARVHLEAGVETRPGNWHDMFNALAWLAWPRAKAALNAVHVRAMPDEKAVKAQRRGVARDVATLFDEGGAVLACSDPALAGLLRGFHWKELFCTRRAEVQAAMRCYIFGHALFDRARAPYKAMTAHALIFPVTADFFRQAPALQVRALDAMLAGWFGDHAHLDSTRHYAPLPALGFPRFCAANADPHFYDDTTVFRPGRMRVKQS